MSETIDIRENEDELVIDIPARSVGALFFGQFRAPVIAFGLLGLGAIAFGWWIGTDARDIVLGTGIYLAIVLGVMAIAMYRQVRPIGEPARLRVDDGGVHLRIGDHGNERRFAFDDVQVLQTTEMPSASRNAKGPVFQLPGDERHELTLMTASDMHVVARGVDRDEAEEAVRLFHEHLPESSAHD